MKTSKQLEDPQKQEMVKRGHFSFRINVFFFQRICPVFRPDR